MRLPRRHPIRLELQLAVEAMGTLLSLAVNLASPKPKSFGAKPMTIGRTSSAGGNIALDVFKGTDPILHFPDLTVWKFTLSMPGRIGGNAVCVQPFTDCVPIQRYLPERRPSPSAV